MSGASSRNIAFDPIDMEIVRHELLAIPNQIGRNMERTAFSPLVQEYKDYSVGFVGPDGALIAQSRGSLPVFIANALGTAVREGLDVFGADGLHHGDAVLSNNPATLGQHLNNVVLYTPVREGGAADGPLLGFFAVLVHWLDIGGYAPGSCTSGATTDIWQEGLQIPSMKLLDRGEPVEGMRRMLAANSRFPLLLIGDLEAQLAACLMGRDLVLAIARRRGAPMLRAAIHAMRRQAAEAARAVIRSIPPGVYRAESFLDGENGVTVKVGIEVRTDGERLTVDLGGLGPQMSGPSNAGRNGGAVAAARIAAKYLLTPQEPVNQGDFDLLDVVAPDGTFLTASPDAPIGGSGNTIPTVVDTILRAMGEALPDRARAAHHGTYGLHIFYGRLPESGELFTNIDTATGGWGASASEDGAFPLRSNAHGDVADIPIEMQEVLYPFRIESKRLRTDSGGAGRRRGGLGVEKVYQLLTPLTVSLKFERRGCPPWGLAGGEAAEVCHVDVCQDDATIRTGKGLYQLKGGDRMRVASAGGGGYGPAREREPERVEHDVAQGYVGIAQARERYLVVLRDDGSLDKAATEALRAAH